MRRFALAFAVLSWTSFFTTPARAADEDTQFWGWFNTAIPLDDGVDATFEISPRLREGDDQLLLRGTVDFDLSDGVSVGGGAAWVEYAGGHEFRPHQQLQVSAGPLSFRTRVEERFFAGADRAQIRLRQRVQASQRLDDATRLSQSVEFLYIAQSQVSGGDARTDSWRFDISGRRRLSAHLDATIGYRAIYGPRKNAPDTLAHVPHVTLTWRP